MRNRWNYVIYISSFVFLMYFWINKSRRRTKQGGVYIIILVLEGTFIRGDVKKKGAFVRSITKILLKSQIFLKHETLWNIKIKMIYTCIKIENGTYLSDLLAMMMECISGYDQLLHNFQIQLLIDLNIDSIIYYSANNKKPCLSVFCFFLCNESGKGSLWNSIKKFA